MQISVEATKTDKGDSALPTVARKIAAGAHAVFPELGPVLFTEDDTFFVVHEGKRYRATVAPG